MIRARALLAILALLITPSVAAQGSVTSVSQWAKWPALGAAVGFTVVALVRNRDADRVYAALNTFCREAPNACRTETTDGTLRYVAPEPEVLYQETLRLDRQARRWVFAGQTALLAAGMMFFIDLVSGDDGPRNIPFDGAEFIADGRRVGLRVAF